MSIELFNYQEEAINRIFGEEEKIGLFQLGKRSAAVVLPTGGGKSFVAMRSIEKMMEMNKAVPSEESKAINDFGMCYFAPNTGILYQFRLHMAENMIYSHYLENLEEYNKVTGNISSNSIKHAVQTILQNMYPDGIEKLDYDTTYKKVIEENNFQPEDNAEKIVKAIVKENLKSLMPKDLEKVVSQSYPQMKFECYQNLPNLDLKKLNAKYYIFDEAHRGGADTWIKSLEKLVKMKTDSFFLSITATPERNSDDRSLLEKIAKYTGYNPEEILEREFYAKEYYLLDAIKDERVINPKIVGFTSTLDESPEYKEVLASIQKLKDKGIKWGSSDDRKYTALLVIKDKMDEIIGKKGLSEEEWEVRKKELIEQTILGNSEKHSRFNRNGKYIAFIPDSKGIELTEEEIERLPKDAEERSKAESKLKSKKNVYKYISKLKELFGNDITPLVYHSIQSEKQNDYTLQQFGALSSDEGGNKFIITNKKLDEGVHVEDADGEIMLDVISENAKKSLSSKLLQQLGRCIRATIGEEEQKVPTIYDYANNFMRNFELFKLNGQIVLDYDQNSTNSSRFFELYEIFQKGVKEHKRVIKSGEEWDEFIVGKNEHIKFPNFEREKELYKKKAPERYETLIKALEILEKVNVEPKLNLKAISPDTVINDDFFEKINIPTEEKNRIKGFLIDCNAISTSSKEYNIGEELNKVKKVFYGVEHDAQMKKVLSNPDLDITKIARLGVIYVSMEDRLLPEYEDIVDINGFIKPSLKMLNNTDNQKPDISFLEKFVGLNVSTGTKYYLGRDEYGCFEPGTKDEHGNDIGGYDIYGYDKFGFNKDGIHRLTGQKYNERYFTKVTKEDGKVEFSNVYTGQSIDVFGYDINGINPTTGFDRGRLLPSKQYIKHYWHKLNETTRTFSRLHTEYNIEENPPTDEYGAPKSNKTTQTIFLTFGRDRISSDTNSRFDDSGLDIDRFNKNGFKKVKIKNEDGTYTDKYFHRDTSSEYDMSGRDYNGNLEPNFKKGIEIIQFIFKNKDTLSNQQNTEKIISVLKNRYEKDGNSLDSILDKALTMYRISPNSKKDAQIEGSLSFIQEKFNDTEYEKCTELIKEISPKFSSQIEYSSEYKKIMNNTFNSKIGLLVQSIQERYGSIANMPKSIQEKMAIFNKKYRNKSSLFLRMTENNDPDYREF